MALRIPVFRTLSVALGLLLAGAACNGKDDASGVTGGEAMPVDVPVPAADGPRLASIDKVTPVYERPATDAPQIGYLRAGASVARAPEAIGTDGCPGGWYPIRPRGFVCVGSEATLNLAHPTLASMKTLPSREGVLPYRYLSAKKPTSLYEWDRAKGAAVREVGKLRRWARVAVIGSWSAQTPEGKTARLAMLPDGRFVDADVFEESTGSDFKGTALDKQNQLPIAYVLRQGIRAWQLEGKDAKKLGRLEPMTLVGLTGRFRTIGDLKFWATSDDRYVRHRDVTVFRRRDNYPDFATGDQKWIDVSVITGTMVMYEGHKPVYATLCSVGHDRLGDPETGPTTQMGTFTITGKHLTASEPGKKPFEESFEVLDAPWAQMMSSGQMIHGAMWHSRFGVEHGPGNIQLSPADAAWLFAWSTPGVPEGWHGLSQPAEEDPKTMVVVRK